MAARTGSLDLEISSAPGAAGSTRAEFSRCDVRRHGSGSGVGYRVDGHDVCMGEIVEYWIDRIETLLRRCVRDREVLPESQSIDIRFPEFMADDIAMVKRIYELAGLEMTEGARGQLASYMEANPRGKYGRVRYDLMADFGVDPKELRKRFSFYFDRFNVVAEGE